MKPDWNGVLTIFLGTLPLLGSILWNLLKLDRMETRLDKIQERLDKLNDKVNDIDKRLSKLEGKLEGRHLIIE